MIFSNINILINIYIYVNTNYDYDLCDVYYISPIYQSDSSSSSLSVCKIKIIYIIIY